MSVCACNNSNSRKDHDLRMGHWRCWREIGGGRNLDVEVIHEVFKTKILDEVILGEQRKESRSS